jgi:hypothetical protein
MQYVATHVACARAEQGQAGFMEWSFPNNFLSGYGKFAKNNWMKKASAMQKEVNS